MPLLYTLSWTGESFSVSVPRGRGRRQASCLQGRPHRAHDPSSRGPDTPQSNPGASQAERRKSRSHLHGHPQPPSLCFTGEQCLPSPGVHGLVLRAPGEPCLREAHHPVPERAPTADSPSTGGRALAVWQGGSGDLLQSERAPFSLAQYFCLFLSPFPSL